MEDFYNYKTVSSILDGMKENYDNKKDFSCVDDYPLAMAYMPMQKFEKLYDVDYALDRGTLFKELDKPFTGRKFY